MTPRQLVLSVLGMLSSLGLAAAAAAAPPIQASAQAARNVVQLGEPVRITIRVNDSEEIPQIDAPTVEGMSISSTGTAEVTPSLLRNVRRLPNNYRPATGLLQSLRDLSQQLGSVSGGMPSPLSPPGTGGDKGREQLAQQYQQMLKQRLGNLNRSDYAIVYLATPEKIGPITVPPFTVHANGQTVQTRPIDLTVTPARPSPWVQAALSLSDPEPRAGDTVNLYVDLLVRRPTQQIGRSNPNLKSQPINHVTLTVPSLEGYQEIQPLEPLEQFVAKRRLPPGQLGYHINHFPGVILLEQEPEGEQLDPQWYRRRLTLPFRAVQAGEVVVPPLRVAGEVYVPAGGKNRHTWEGFVASSSPLTFRVRQAIALPAAPVPVRKAISPLTARSHAEGEDEEDAADEPTPPEGSWFPKAAMWAAAGMALLVMARAGVILRRRLPLWRQQAAQGRKQRQAVERARQRLRTPPQTAAEISAAVQEFLRAHLEMAPGEITPEEAAEHLRQAGYSAELAQACAELLRDCAARQFAPPATAEEESGKELAAAERLVSAILAAKPKDRSAPAALVDELTRERQAALAD